MSGHPAPLIERIKPLPTLNRFRLLTLHAALFGLSTAMAGGFAGAYLLTLGFSLPAALAAYGALLVLRFGLRGLAIAIVRRVGMAGALRLGVLIGAVEFLPLLAADSALGLLAWILLVSLAEAIYWPVFHATTVTTVAGDDSLGRQVAERTMVSAVVAVAGPLAGGLLLAGLGEAAGFGIAALVGLLSILPVARLGRVEAGPVPRLGEVLRGMDRRGVAIFAADGWISSGLAFVWPMVMFAAMGSSYQAFGFANAAAGLVGAAVSPWCGRAIDRGQRDRTLVLVCAALVASFALRAAAAWSPLAAALANVTGAAICGLYGPVLYSALYARARRSGAPYRFHLAAEAGWDCGAACGLFVAAGVAALVSVPALAVLPASLGIGALYLCIRTPRPARPAFLSEGARPI